MKVHFVIKNMLCFRAGGCTEISSIIKTIHHSASVELMRAVTSGTTPNVIMATDSGDDNRRYI